MKIVISGRVQPGKNDASHWLGKFNGPYSKTTGMAIFPGSLNLGLNQNFDWFAPIYSPTIVWFGKNEYDGLPGSYISTATRRTIADAGSARQASRPASSREAVGQVFTFNVIGK